ncbi:MAG: dihydroorotase family protein [Acidimicrobiia bacterium]|nr:dihydroorotase family protein [Acidimicrobiia bacterium]MDH3397270.1 dihydroorotase family protein [Acidimicrobiia bacterium]
MADVTVKGGTVVTGAGRQRLDLGIHDGSIVAGELDLPAAGSVIDASGLLVLPGMVDTHVHLMDPGPTEREDFPTGSAAAAARGVTTIVEHTHAHPIRGAEDLIEKRRYLAGRSHVDFGLAAHVWPDRIDRLAELWAMGTTFFKVFTCTTHGVPGLDSSHLLDTLRAVAGFGGICLVHCEDELITSEAERTLKEAGRVDPTVIIEWRSREAEQAAIALVATLVRLTKARATIAHVSTPEAARLVSEAQAAGADLAAEACPQYFALREDEILEHGPFRKFTPPARVRSDSEQKEMLDLLAAGVFSHLATDHAPSTAAQKTAGNIWDAPFGLPGLDSTFPWLLDLALTGRIPLEKAVDLYAEAPARRYGLAPRKGRLGRGADADFVLVDPESTFTLTDETVISKAGWSPYSGRAFHGQVVGTYLRGTEIAFRGATHEARKGVFLPGPGAV